MTEHPATQEAERWTFLCLFFSILTIPELCSSNLLRTTCVRKVLEVLQDAWDYARVLFMVQRKSASTLNSGPQTQEQESNTSNKPNQIRKQGTSFLLEMAPAIPKVLMFAKDAKQSQLSEWRGVSPWALVGVRCQGPWLASGFSKLISQHGCP